MRSQVSCFINNISSCVYGRKLNTFDAALGSNVTGNESKMHEIVCLRRRLQRGPLTSRRGQSVAQASLKRLRASARLCSPGSLRQRYFPGFADTSGKYRYVGCTDTRRLLYRLIVPMRSPTKNMFETHLSEFAQSF